MTPPPPDFSVNVVFFGISGILMTWTPYSGHSNSFFDKLKLGIRDPDYYTATGAKVKPSASLSFSVNSSKQNVM